MASAIPVVALTGGIASGKTLVAERLQALGAAIIDTDRIARDVVQPGSAGLEAVVEAFGASVLSASGELDRAAMRKRIFSQPEARRRLEALLHPLIETEARRRLAALSDAPYAVLVVPLLIETGLFSDVGRIIAVDLPEQMQIERLIGRDQASETAAWAALSAQATREQRLARADQVIDNSGTVEQLMGQVDELHQRLLDELGSRHGDSGAPV